MASLPGRATRRWTLKPPAGTPLNALSPLAQGLVGHWGMNEGAGTRLGNLGLVSAPGVATGSSWAWKGTIAPLFQCPTFPGGTTDVLTVTHQAALSPVSKSVAAWFITTTTGAVVQEVVCKSSDYILRVESTRKLAWYVWTTGSARFVLTGANMPTGVPIFGVGTWDGTTQRLYLNGLQATTQAPGGATTTSTVDLTFGNATAGTEPLFGSVGLAMLWNRALTPAEVMELYVNPFALWAPQPALHQQLVPVAPAVIPPTGGGIARLNVGRRPRGPGMVATW